MTTLFIANNMFQMIKELPSKPISVLVWITAYACYIISFKHVLIAIKTPWEGELVCLFIFCFVFKDSCSHTRKISITTASPGWGMIPHFLSTSGKKGDRWVKCLPCTFPGAGFSGSSLDAVDFETPLPILINQHEDWKTQKGLL